MCIIILMKTIKVSDENWEKLQIKKIKGKLPSIDKVIDELLNNA